MLQEQDFQEKVPSADSPARAELELSACCFLPTLCKCMRSPLNAWLIEAVLVQCALTRAEVWLVCSACLT